MREDGEGYLFFFLSSKANKESFRFLVAEDSRKGVGWRLYAGDVYRQGCPGRLHLPVSICYRGENANGLMKLANQRRGT